MISGSNSLIPARSEAEVMDWGLVLASQNIEASIEQTETGWALSVSESDHERALVALNQYQKENRTWRWRRELPGSDLLFHYGSVLWVSILAAFYLWAAGNPQVKEAGVADSMAIAHGEWWRLLTAVTLHADIAHLFSNLATGFLLLGLAMARYGPGIAALAAFIAGICGNVAGQFLYTHPHVTLGASGMVLGAL